MKLNFPFSRLSDITIINYFVLTGIFADSLSIARVNWREKMSFSCVFLQYSFFPFMDSKEGSFLFALYVHKYHL